MITSQIRKVTSVGAGTADPFDLANMIFLDANDVTVYRIVGGAYQALVASTDYVIEGDGRLGQGRVRPLAVRPNGEIWEAERKTPAVQTLNPSDSRPLRAAALEGALDRLALSIQDKGEDAPTDLTRAVLAPIGESDVRIVASLSSRSGQIAMYDTAGQLDFLSLTGATLTALGAIGAEDLSYLVTEKQTYIDAATLRPYVQVLSDNRDWYQAAYTIRDGVQLIYDDSQADDNIGYLAAHLQLPNNAVTEVGLRRLAIDRIDAELTGLVVLSTDLDQVNPANSVLKTLAADFSGDQVLTGIHGDLAKIRTVYNARTAIIAIDADLSLQNSRLEALGNDLLGDAYTLAVGAALTDVIAVSQVSGTGGKLDRVLGLETSMDSVLDLELELEAFLQNGQTILDGTAGNASAANSSAAAALGFRNQTQVLFDNLAPINTNVNEQAAEVATNTILAQAWASAAPGVLVDGVFQSARGYAQTAINERGLAQEARVGAEAAETRVQDLKTELDRRFVLEPTASDAGPAIYQAVPVLDQVPEYDAAPPNFVTYAARGSHVDDFPFASPFGPRSSFVGLARRRQGLRALQAVVMSYAVALGAQTFERVGDGTYAFSDAYARESRIRINEHFEHDEVLSQIDLALLIGQSLTEEITGPGKSNINSFPASVAYGEALESRLKMSSRGIDVFDEEGSAPINFSGDTLVDARDEVLGAPDATTGFYTRSTRGRYAYGLTYLYGATAQTPRGQAVLASLGRGSQLISYFAKDGAWWTNVLVPWLDWFVTQIPTGRAVVNVPVFWEQGQANHNAGTSEAAYRNALVQFVADFKTLLVAKLGSQINFVFVCGPTARIHSVDDPAIGVQQYEISAVARAQFKLGLSVAHPDIFCDQSHAGVTHSGISHLVGEEEGYVHMLQFAAHAVNWALNKRANGVKMLPTGPRCVIAVGAGATNDEAELSGARWRQSNTELVIPWHFRSGWGWLEKRTGANRFEMIPQKPFDGLSVHGGLPAIERTYFDWSEQALVVRFVSSVTGQGFIGFGFFDQVSSIANDNQTDRPGYRFVPNHPPSYLAEPGVERHDGPGCNIVGAQGEVCIQTGRQLHHQPPQLIYRTPAVA
ncbi:MAG: hypothetical protein AAGF20_00325 [Pseudomonadota bacterium]